MNKKLLIQIISMINKNCCKDQKVVLENFLVQAEESHSSSLPSLAMPSCAGRGKSLFFPPLIGHAFLCRQRKVTLLPSPHWPCLLVQAEESHSSSLPSLAMPSCAGRGKSLFFPSLIGHASSYL